MNSPADVTTTRALEDLRTALLDFADVLRQTLTEAELTTRKQEDWLKDQADRWHGEGRRAEAEVRRAKLELERRRRTRIGDRTPDTTEQEEALQRAKFDLNLAEEKQAAVRRWLLAWPDAVLEYQGPVRQLGFFGESDLPRMAAFLRDRIEDLEAYEREES